ncbi:MAG: hypothetical protein Q8J99_09175 [Sulfuritalea sp.]|nr:hypothetical protein [Sulfuritalea sp.]
MQYEIFREITLETSARFDKDQNISDFNKNNNNINMVYGLMGWPSPPEIRQPGVPPGEKKGCATRTPNPNREPSGDGAKPSP